MKKKTLRESWLERGVDIDAIDKLIDMFPEGSEVCEGAKDLVSSILDIENPSEEVQLASVKKDGEIINGQRGN